MTIGKAALVGLAVIGAMLLVACEGTPSESEAQADYCEALSDLDSSLAGMASLSGDTSVDDAEAALDQVQDDYERVRNAAGDLAEVQELESAVEGLNSALDDLPDDATLAAAAGAIQDAVIRVQDVARGALSASEEC